MWIAIAAIIGAGGGLVSGALLYRYLRVGLDEVLGGVHNRLDEVGDYLADFVIEDDEAEKEG